MCLTVYKCDSGSSCMQPNRLIFHFFLVNSRKLLMGLGATDPPSNSRACLQFFSPCFPFALPDDWCEQAHIARYVHSVRAQVAERFKLNSNTVCLRFGSTLFRSEPSGFHRKLHQIWSEGPARVPNAIGWHGCPFISLHIGRIVCGVVGFHLECLFLIWLFMFLWPFGMLTYSGVFHFDKQFAGIHTRISTMLAATATTRNTFVGVYTEPQCFYAHNLRDTSTTHRPPPSPSLSQSAHILCRIIQMSAKNCSASTLKW